MNELLIRSTFVYEHNTGKLYRKTKTKGLKECNAVSHGYYTTSINCKFEYVHRICWFLYYGAWPENDIDHINGEKTDNRIKNLRDVTRSENLRNGKVHRTGRLVGAHTVEGASRMPWRSSVWDGKKLINLGRFDTEQEAHDAYMNSSNITTREKH